AALGRLELLRLGLGLLLQRAGRGRIGDQRQKRRHADEDPEPVLDRLPEDFLELVHGLAGPWKTFGSSRSRPRSAACWSILLRGPWVLGGGRGRSIGARRGSGRGRGVTGRGGRRRASRRGGRRSLTLTLRRLLLRLFPLDCVHDLLFRACLRRLGDLRL